LLVSLHTPMFLPRIMLWAPFPFYVLAGHGTFALRGRVLPTLAVLLALGGGLLSLLPYYYGQSSKPRWDEVARMLSAQYDKHTVVLTTGSQERTALNYYFQRRHDPVVSVPTLTVDPSRVKRHVGRADTVWLVDGKRGKRERTKQLRAELERGARLVWEGKYLSVAVLKFDRAKREQPRKELPKEPPGDDDEQEFDDDSADAESVHVED
jgi:hypothetical protein